ncbi:cytochrome P450 [Actinoplanes sp. NBC_00393]|uniref:cytochrome P450 n=1 Tax=Actinoplanes sp. NBC_00393 TaxID=2975953 RepID=UPI003FA4733C
MLHEILRLEPVVADLLRWTTADVTLGEVTIPSGAKVDVGVAAANLDGSAVGPDPAAVCPGRPYPTASPTQACPSETGRTAAPAPTSPSRRPTSS